MADSAGGEMEDRITDAVADLQGDKVGLLRPLAHVLAIPQAGTASASALIKALSAKKWRDIACATDVLCAGQFLDEGFQRSHPNNAKNRDAREQKKKANASAGKQLQLQWIDYLQNYLSFPERPHQRNGAPSGAQADPQAVSERCRLSVGDGHAGQAESGDETKADATSVLDAQDCGVGDDGVEEGKGTESDPQAVSESERLSFGNGLPGQVQSGDESRAPVLEAQDGGAEDDGVEGGKGAEADPQAKSEAPSMSDELIGFLRSIVQDGATGPGGAGVATRGGESQERVWWTEWRSFCGRVQLKQVTASAVIDFPFADEEGLNLKGDKRLLERAYVFDDPRFNADATKKEVKRVVLHVHTLVRWGDRDANKAKRALKITSVNVRFAVSREGGAAGTFEQQDKSKCFILPRSDELNREGKWRGLFETPGGGSKMEWNWKNVRDSTGSDRHKALPLLENKDNDTQLFYQEVAKVIALGDKLCTEGKWTYESGSRAETNKVLRGDQEGPTGGGGSNLECDFVREAAPGPAPLPGQSPSVLVPEHALLEMMDLLDIVSDEPSDDAQEKNDAQSPVRGMKRKDLDDFFDGVDEKEIVPTCIVDFPYSDKSTLNLQGDDRLLERMYCFQDLGKADRRIVVHAHTLLRWGDRQGSGKERAMFVTSVNVRHAVRSSGHDRFRQELGKLPLVPVGQSLKQKGKWQEIYSRENKLCKEKRQGFLQGKSSLTWKLGFDGSMPSDEGGGENVSSLYQGVREVLMKGEALCRDVEPIEAFSVKQTEGGIRGRKKKDRDEFELVGFQPLGGSVLPSSYAAYDELQQKRHQAEEQYQRHLVLYPSARPPAFETDGAIRVLFLGINTKGQVHIDVADEHRRMFKGMYGALGERLFHRVQIHSDYFSDPDEFLWKLRCTQPSILHFGCHGEDEGLHFFDNFVKRKDLAGVLRGGSVRVVVINACHSLETAESLSKAVDFVIGFDQALPDKQAIGFSGTLYSELAFEKSLAEAFENATLSSRRKNYRLFAEEYDPRQMLIFSKPDPVQASDLPRTYAHIMVQQVPMLTSTGSELLHFHHTIDRLKSVLENVAGIPSGHSCLTDGKKKLAWEHLAHTSLHILVWSAKGTSAALQEGWGVLAPPPPSEEHINEEHICSALGRIPEHLRPRIIFVCHCHGARATAELLCDEGVAGAVVWIGSDLLSTPELLEKVILRVCTSSQEGVQKELENAAKSVRRFESEWESRCGIVFPTGKHIERKWGEKCDKRSVSKALTCSQPPPRLFQHFKQEKLKPLSFDTDSIVALKGDLIDMAESAMSIDMVELEDSERFIHVVAEKGLASGHAASRCRSVAGQACLTALCGGGSNFRCMFFVETSADVRELRDEVSRQVEKRDFCEYSMLVWIDLTSRSQCDELLVALKELVETFPLLVGVLTSADGEHGHAERIANTLPITERCYVRAIPSGERTAKADSLHEEIKFTFLDQSCNPSVKLIPLKTFEIKALWLLIKEALQIDGQKQRPIACLYAGDDSSLLVRICISDVGYLHSLRDRILLGTVQKRLAHSLNESGARMKGDGDVIVEIDRTHFAESYGDLVLCLETLTAHQEECILQCGASEDVHVMAPAGAGKTFIALHLVLESINAWLKQGPSQESFVLFVANNQGMALSFATWLCKRVKKVEGMNRQATIKLVMPHLHFMFSPFNKGPFSVSIEQDDSGGQMLLLQEIDGSAPNSYSIVVVDEAHHVYCCLAAADRSFVDVHVPLKRRTGTRRILLSDISQSDGREIPYPEGLVTVKLTEVVRSTKRIVLGAMSFQLSEGEGHNQTKCQHDAVGPHMKALLFPSNTAVEGTDDWYEMYAARVVEALQKFVLSEESGYPGMNLDCKLAILVPDKDFRDGLKPALEESLKRHGPEAARISLVDAVKASQTLPWTVPRRVKESKQEVVLDTVDEFDGLERLIVLVVGLDKAGSATGGEDAVRKTRSRFYRAVTRAHMQVVVVNVFEPDGWLEFLGHVRVDTEPGFDEDLERQRMKNGAALKAVNSSKERDAREKEIQRIGDELAAARRQKEIASMDKPQRSRATKVKSIRDEEHDDSSDSQESDPEDVAQQVDEFVSKVWDNSVCSGLVKRTRPGWSPQESQEAERLRKEGEARAKEAGGGELLRWPAKCTVAVFACQVGTGGQVYREAKEIERLLRKRPDLFQVFTQPLPSPEDFADCICRCTRDNIVGLHFAGYTNEAGELVVCEGKIRRSGKEPLPEAFSQSSFVEQMRLGAELTLRFVFLNACESVHLGRRLVECGVAYVICWVDSVSDSMALQFCKRFYKYLVENPGRYGGAFRSAASMHSSRRDRPCLLWRDGALDEEWTGREGREGAIVWMDGKFVPLSSVEVMPHQSGMVPSSGEDESSQSEGGNEGSDDEEEGELRGWLGNGSLSYASKAGGCEKECLRALKVNLLLNGQEIREGNGVVGRSEQPYFEVVGNPPRSVGLRAGSLKREAMDAITQPAVGYTYSQLWGRGGFAFGRAEQLLQDEGSASVWRVEKAARKLTEALQHRVSDQQRFSQSDDGSDGMRRKITDARDALLELGARYSNVQMMTDDDGFVPVKKKK